MQHNTDYEEISRFHLVELRSLAAAALRGPLAWRHHAIGVLQAYLSEGDLQEVRIHIWHPDLVGRDVAAHGGRVHDHRFRLVSTVLAGSIGHEELSERGAADGGWAEFTVQHARAGAAPLRKTGDKLHLESVERREVPAGVRYDFPARRFHRSFVVEPAVTLVTKLATEEVPARVLFPVGVTPTFGVTTVDADEARPYVDIAIRALTRR